MARKYIKVGKVTVLSAVLLLTACAESAMKPLTPKSEKSALSSEEGELDSETGSFERGQEGAQIAGVDLWCGPGGPNKKAKLPGNVVIGCAINPRGGVFKFTEKVDYKGLEVDIGGVKASPPFDVVADVNDPWNFTFEVRAEELTKINMITVEYEFNGKIWSPVNPNPLPSYRPGVLTMQIAKMGGASGVYGNQITGKKFLVNLNVGGTFPVSALVLGGEDYLLKVVGGSCYDASKLASNISRNCTLEMQFGDLKAGAVLTTRLTIQYFDGINQQSTDLDFGAITGIKCGGAPKGGGYGICSGNFPNYY